MLFTSIFKGIDGPMHPAEKQVKVLDIRQGAIKIEADLKGRFKA